MTPAELLAFERRPWRHPGPKERAIRELFGLSPIRYYQALSSVIDDPASLEIDPTTVMRLRRLREARQPVR